VVSAARLGIVVPARNEEELLPGCLAALRTAVAAPGRSGTPVRVVVVADGCTDDTVALARAGGAVVLGGGRAAVGNVGAARDAGVRWLLADAATAGVPPERLWVATTDADSVVPPDWLVLHETAAASGVDAVVGTVAVGDWTGHRPEVAAAFEAAYSAWRSGGPAPVHPHVHGAHLGVRGSAYLACGGFPAVPVSEDVALVRALEGVGATILRTPASPVLTSARRVPRARGGFGDDIDRMASDLSGC
jgi:glycosyltransferase involved in cell wall biosynthesis